MVTVVIIYKERRVIDLDLLTGSYTRAFTFCDHIQTSGVAKKAEKTAIVMPYIQTSTSQPVWY